MTGEKGGRQCVGTLKHLEEHYVVQQGGGQAGEIHDGHLFLQDVLHAQGVEREWGTDNVVHG